MLIAIEGIDGAGKTTQATLLCNWLENAGVPVVATKWNSSSIVKPASRKGKKFRALTPTTFALLEAADLADRHDRSIVPALDRGTVVVADRWVPTAFARGMARGLNAAWLRGIYSFARKPDLTFYLALPVESALQRILQEREVKHYEAGMDLELSSDPLESFREFQSVALAAYSGMQMVEECFVMLDAEASVKQLHEQIVEVVKNSLPERPHVEASAR